MTMDNTSVLALAGIIFCQIMEGHISEAEQQLEFLAEVSPCSINHSSGWIQGGIEGSGEILGPRPYDL